MLTLASGNAAPPGSPNAWLHVPSRYRADAPLRLAIVFHGFENCLASFVSERGAPCRPGGPTRTGADLEVQVERSATSAVTLVPQLAYDAKSGDPGVLGGPAALEKLTRDALAAIGRSPEELERVVTIAISGGYQALYATFGAFGARLRGVYFLDGYYAEGGPVDRWLLQDLAQFSPAAPEPRRFGSIYTTIVATQTASRSLARRVLAAGVDPQQFVHRATPHDVTVEELRTPIAILFSSREHDDVPRHDLGKALAASL